MKNKKNILEKLKQVFAEDGNQVVDYVDVKTVDEVILRFTPEMVEGATVKIMNEDGSLVTPDPEMEYVLDNGMKLKVGEDAKVESLVEVEMEAEDEPVKEEVIVEEEVKAEVEEKVIVEDEVKAEVEEKVVVEELAHTPEHKEEEEKIEKMFAKFSELVDKFASLETKLSDMTDKNDTVNEKLNTLNEAVQTFTCSRTRSKGIKP